MSCRDESNGHDHGHHDDHHEHHHHGNGHDHAGHDHESYERGLEFNLYKYIDTSKVICLNRKEDGKPINCFRNWADRLDKSSVVESDVDEQLIFHIPFTGAMTIKAILVIGGTDDSSPKTLKAFVNREDIDFTTVEDIPVQQQWDLHEDPTGVLEYQTKITKFQNVTHLTLFIPDNFGADSTKVHYIGLKGEYRELRKNPVITLYESAPNPADHKTKNQFTMDHSVQ